METAIIYIKQKELESMESLLSSTKTYINKLRDNYIIKNVLLENYNETIQLDKFINMTPKNIDVFIVDHFLQDEFSLIVLNEISNLENFRIKYIKRLE